MAESECQSLPVWSDGKQCVSCWKPTFKERLNILFGGKVWLGVLSGKTQPPVFISGESVFEKANIKERFRAFIAEAKESIIETFESVREAAKQPDKRKHFIVGFCLSLFFGFFLPFMGFIAALIAGTIKEWWDSKGHGTVEVLDLVFTAMGALCAFPFAWVVHALIW